MALVTRLLVSEEVDESKSGYYFLFPPFLVLVLHPGSI